MVSVNFCIRSVMDSVANEDAGFARKRVTERTKRIREILELFGVEDLE